MALIAILRSSSRSMASILDFCTKNRMKRSPAKIATIVISKIVKPFFDFMSLIIAQNML